MKKYFYFLICISIFSCKKDTPTPLNPRNFHRGEKYANGIILDVEGINDISYNTTMQNWKITVMGMNDYTDLTFTESLNLLPTLRDEFGDWNSYTLAYAPSFYDKTLEDSLIKNGGSPLLKNTQYWFNQLSDGISGGIFVLNNSYSLSSMSTTSLTTKRRIRPTRYVTYYNTPIKSYKVGDEYKYGAKVFYVDSVNRKLKVFKKWGEYTNWNDVLNIVKIRIYDGDYGFRIPTLDEIRAIQAVNITQSFSCWTSDVDPSNSLKAFTFNTNWTPQQVNSFDKSTSGSFAQQIVGVKEVSY